MKFPFVYLFLIIPSILVAQSSKLFVKHFTMHDGLSQMKTTCMIQDSRGYIWIGTRNGLNRFNGESFTVFTEEDGLLHNRVHKIVEDKQGRLLILTFNGISIYDGSRFRNYPHPFNTVLYDIALDQNALLILGEKLWVFQDGKYSDIEISNKASLKFHRDRSTDQVYLFLDEQGVYRVDHDSLQFMFNLPAPIFDKYPMANDPIQIKLGDNKTEFYQITNGQIELVSVLQYDMAIDHKPNDFWHSTTSSISFVDGFGSRKHINAGFIRPNSLFHDSQLNTWISAENGIGVITANQFDRITYDNLPYVWSIVEDQNRSLWFATYGNGLFRQIPGGEIERVATPQHYNNFFASSLLDEDGSMYFTNESGLIKINMNSEIELLYRGTTFSVCQDDSLLFTGALGAVFVYKDDSIVEKISQEDGLHPNDYIQNLGIDADKHLWAGSYSGVSRIKISNLKVKKNYLHANGTLPMKSVFCSYLDDDGHFWLGGDSGLMLHHPKKDQVEKVISYWLDEPVKSIIQFDEDQLLLGCKSGLYLFNTTQFFIDNSVGVKVLNHTNGYLGIEPGFTGFHKDHQGSIWVCSATSVDRIEPDKIHLGDQLLQINILSANDSALHLDHADQIFVLNRGEDNLKMTYEAIGTIRAKQTKYQVRLDNEPWGEWTVDNQFVFNRLSHGEHRFQVRAGPTDLLPNHTPVDEITISVHLRFYQRAFFIPLLTSLFIIVSTWLALILQRRSRERRQLEQTQLKAKYFQSQLLLSELNPHFIFNVLASIQNKILTDKKEKASEYIIKLSKLMRNFLDASHQSNHLDNTLQQEIELSKEIELLESFVEFEHEKSNHHFDYRISYDPKLTRMGLTIPPLLIQPYVENAIKHGLLPDEKKGELLVSFDYLNRQLRINIVDNGIGRKKAQQRTRKQQRTSLGSSILEQRIALLNELGYGITVEIKDNIPQGTIVTLQIKDE